MRKRKEQTTCLKFRHLIKKVFFYPLRTFWISYRCLLCFSKRVYIWLNTRQNIFSRTSSNTLISPNFLVWIFCGKAQFPHSFGRFACRNCSFPQNFRTRKLGEITVFDAVPMIMAAVYYRRHLWQCCECNANECW